MPPDNIKVSEQARDQLIKLKRNTGIQNWNVLCRWAFCVSLSEPTDPLTMRASANSSVEMTWKVFAGEHGDLYWLALKEHCSMLALPLTEEMLALKFRQHLHRGISYLAADKKLVSIEALLSKVITSSNRPKKS